ncbi:hypothetical protein BG015_002152 [Linnemannia schmuckeri]|uniref:Uncharacterized protein n=1 Tax=Linnemannia schmuckeri TaxID=64567 RepID=A0A9P5RSA8_9FUNG|nr:hypothetical protein BG015_002152 [Linnemannia schmuckeri]
MDEPASIRVFNIPELVSLITSHLDRDDLSRLLRTSQHMHTHCIPFLFKNLSLQYVNNGGGIFQSIVATLALAKNVQHVRSLVVNKLDAVYLFNCLIDFQETHARVAGVPFVRPRWLPPPDPRTCQLIALPPLKNLTTLRFNMNTIEFPTDCRYIIPSYKSTGAALPQVCWIIRQSPHLAYLEIQSITIQNPGRIRLLTDTIAALDFLKELSLTIISPKEDWLSIGSALFFSCSPTLEKFTTYMEPVSGDGDNGTDPSIETQEWYLQAKEGEKDVQGKQIAAPRRIAPLLKLREATLCDMDTTGSRQDVIAVLEHCPNVETLRLPAISKGDSGADLANLIARLCPRVSSLMTAQIPGGADNELPFKVMEALPEQQVETLFCPGSSFRMDEMAARSIFQRHSTILRNLTLMFCGGIQSKAVQTILVECGALEKFEVRGYDTHGGLLIHLEDAIEKPWACTRVKRFDLTVGVPELELIEDSEPYYRRDPPIVLTPDEEQQFAMLEKLYRQIGMLTEVERLDFRLEWLDEDGFPTQDSAYDTNAFPALLSLGDARTGRPGYLHLLAGLKKLRKLRGSVFMDLEETEETVDCKEVVWMDDHWRNLTIAEFFHNAGNEARDCFLWLKKQREHDPIPLTLGYPEDD